MIKIPIEIGDIILCGKFRNKRVIVKTIGTDENGSPTVNGKSILNCRIEKLMKEETDKSIKLMDLVKEDIRNINIRNDSGLKDSTNRYRNINGVRYEHWTSDPGSFAEEIEKFKKEGLKTKIINNELFVEVR